MNLANKLIEFQSQLCNEGIRDISLIMSQSSITSIHMEVLGISYLDIKHDPVGITIRSTAGDIRIISQDALEKLKLLTKDL